VKTIRYFGLCGWISYPSRINGKPIRFLIDTGATRSAILQDLACDLGLEITGRESFNAAQ
jgi:predicted aspartyl protease